MKVGRFGLGFKSVFHMTGTCFFNKRWCIYMLLIVRYVQDLFFKPP